jgi:hypothetical protein
MTEWSISPAERRSRLHTAAFRSRPRGTTGLAPFRPFIDSREACREGFLSFGLVASGASLRASRCRMRPLDGCSSNRGCDKGDTGNWHSGSRRRQAWRTIEPPARCLRGQAAPRSAYGQDLNRRNLHDPWLSPAQFDSRQSDAAVARRLKERGDGRPDQRNVSLVQQPPKSRRALHGGLSGRLHPPRYRSHANGISLPECVWVDRRPMWRAQTRKALERVRGGMSPSRIELDRII